MDLNPSYRNIRVSSCVVGMIRYFHSLSVKYITVESVMDWVVSKRSQKINSLIY